MLFCVMLLVPWGASADDAPGRVDGALESILVSLDAEACDPRVEEIRRLVPLASAPLQDRAIGALMARVDLDVSPYAFALVADRVQQSRGESGEYGTGLEPSVVLPLVRRMEVDEARDTIGLLPLAVEAQVRRDFVHLTRGGPVPEEWARLDDCRAPGDAGDARRDLRRLSLDADRARAVWQKAGFPNEGPEIARVTAADQAAAAWLESRMASGSLLAGSGFGRRDSFAVFLLLQHSGDVDLMSRALPAVARRMLEGRAVRSTYALMLDRVLVLTGREQVYGSQGAFEGEIVVPAPSIKPEAIDSRRELVLLQPIANYYEAMNR